MSPVGEVYAGRYELIDLLGEGASGAVWRVWDRRQRRYVAAKLLRQRDAEGLLRFVREQSLRVVNPHVAPPIGWAAEDHDVLLTMDLVNGGTVAQLLEQNGALPVPFAVQLIDQLLIALAAVHHSGLVHRDVKPGNLLLEPTGDGPPFLRLGDFGVATVLGKPRLTDLGMVLGTPGYVAPEIWLGADPDPRQDLFAAGVLSRQLLTGQRPPSTGPLPMDPPPAGVPDPLWMWVRQLTDHRPEQRPPTADLARTSLHAAMEAAGPQAAQSQRRIVVPDRVGPLPPGWIPAELASQREADVEPPTQIGAAAGWSTQAAAPWPEPGRPVGWTGSPTEVAPAHPATVALSQGPYTAQPGPPAPEVRSTFGPRLGLRLVIAALLIGVAVVAFVLAAGA